MVKQAVAEKKTYLVIPFEQKGAAVLAAGKLPNGQNALAFDDEHKLWYAKPGADLSKVSQWLPDPAKVTSTAAENDPQVEFSNTLENAGFLLDGVPQMDGKRHRVKTHEDKRGQRSGVYVGYLDGVPAGWYQDHRTHTEPVKWRATGKTPDREAQTHIRAQTLQRRMERQAEQARSYDHIARRVFHGYSLMPAASPEQGYLQKKGVKPFPGTKMDKQGRLVLPLINEHEEVRTLQRIDSTGFKSLKKGGQKVGNYFVVGDRGLINGAPILYAEGYSTAASIAEATGRSVVMTVDAGNLPVITQKLKEKYPDSPHVILGDDDRDNKVNKGRDKAHQAAAITGGVFRVPAFTVQELQDGLTDFNDLHQARGLEVVREQVEQVIAQVSGVKGMEPHADSRTMGPEMPKTFDQDAIQDLEQTPDAEVSMPDSRQAPGREVIDAENSIEPKHQHVQPREADSDARAWLQKRRRPLAASLAQESIKTEQKQASLSQIHDEPDETPAVGSIDHQDDTVAAESASKPVVPERVAKSYVEIEGKYYFAGKPELLAFVDKGARLQTKLNNSRVIGSMVDIAEARGWRELQVKGSLDFRREAWLEATARGLDVRGYKPGEADLARLKKMAGDRQLNEIEGQEPFNQQLIHHGGPCKLRPEPQARQPHRYDISADQSMEQETRLANKEDGVNRLAGTVIAHGKDHYEKNPDNRQSYYVTLENADGQKSTTWGIDLERAMGDSGAKQGDLVELENQGRRPVTVNREVKDSNGNVVDTEQINTYRNAWRVKAQALQAKGRDAGELVREHPDLVNELAVIKVAEKFSQQRFSNHADRDSFVDKVRTRVASNVSRGEQAPDVKLRAQRVNEKEYDNER
ncbi:hypothetical protein GCM10011348_28290 [Marinobacterium nitratireducens]|uniref:Toprim domain-containing protein n=1 Tax=Marinobacterium nitratireducens TaxID=518897 RepID=A0A917ZKG8_9GAMM|nr:LPD7 domain-containing protein [Marinobacterium nitratireducens]GGO83764.1 hypothetical protein GCM10011348_28290 [Marinobacterium nitratireducens]